MKTKADRALVFTPADRKILVGAGFSRQVISSWENNVCNPTVRHMLAAATALEMNSTEFLKVLENTRRRKVAMAKVRERKERRRERRAMLERKEEEVQ